VSPVCPCDSGDTMIFVRTGAPACVPDLN
jgi:hypothetical protein